jgi:hypothetical protein
MSIIFLVLIVSALGIAIYTAVKPVPILWISVVLLVIAVAIEHPWGSTLIGR